VLQTRSGSAESTVVDGDDDDALDDDDEIRITAASDSAAPAGINQDAFSRRVNTRTTYA
jgi:hypothetical protein